MKIEKCTICKGARFVAREREIMLKPEALAISVVEDDDLNEHRRKVKVEFSLPKGSYATIILKALFEL